MFVRKNLLTSVPRQEMRRHESPKCWFPPMSRKHSRNLCRAWPDKMRWRPPLSAKRPIKQLRGAQNCLKRLQLTSPICSTGRSRTTGETEPATRNESSRVRSAGGRMRIATITTCLAVALVMPMQWVSAQEKAKGDDTPAEVRPTETTPVKVSVTFVEFEGEKKVKSLPYTIVVIAAGKPPTSVLKMGSRIPVYTGKENGMQYLGVGSNIDCQAFRTKDNKFDVKLDLDRSWVEGDVAVPIDRGISSQSSWGQFPEPIVRQFRSELSLTLRDGQTIESTFATDPLSGKVFKVEVSLSMLK